MDRRVVGELGGDGVGQQPRTAQPLGDRADLGRTGGRDALLGRHRRRVAVAAGVALLDRAEDEERGRFEIELLGRLLSDARAGPAAARAELLGRGQVVDDLPPFEVLGQGRATVLIASGWLLGGGHRRWRPAFAPAAEPVLQGGVEFGLQFGVLGPELLEFGEQLTNHRLERGHVVRQRRIGGERGGVHAPFNPAAAVR